MIPNFIVAALEGRSPLIHGDGEQSRDFTYVNNAVNANLLAASAPGAAGEAFNVACGERTTLNAIVARIADLCGHEVEAVHDDARPGDVRHSLADIGKAREILGYEPQVGFEEGLRRTFAAYEEDVRRGGLERVG